MRTMLTPGEKCFMKCFNRRTSGCGRMAHVQYVGGPAALAHVERQEFDKRGRSECQREAMIKVMAQNRGGRISR